LKTIKEKYEYFVSQKKDIEKKTLDFVMEHGREILNESFRPLFESDPNLTGIVWKQYTEWNYDMKNFCASFPLAIFKKRPEERCSDSIEIEYDNIAYDLGYEDEFDNESDLIVPAFHVPELRLDNARCLTKDELEELFDRDVIIFITRTGCFAFKYYPTDSEQGF
jgi:hypothetical protein